MKIQLEPDAKEYSIIILDCDGVIFDSNRLKTEAFYFALRDYPEKKVNELISYHKFYGGISRYKKFDVFFLEIHEVNNKELAIKSALDDFANFVKRGYQKLKPVDNALEFLKKGYDKVKFYVISGSDQSELQNVFYSHGIKTYFEAIYGSPITKVEHISHIIKAENCPINKILFIGDGKADFDAAEHFGIDFIFLSYMSEWNDAEKFIDNSDNSIYEKNWQNILNRVIS